MENLEKKVVDCILQRQETITIGDKEYQLAPPTPATLILISELVATMPVIDKNNSDILSEVLCKAKDLSVLGQIAATLILGAKRIKERNHIILKTSPFRRKKVLEYDYISELILNEITNASLMKLITSRLNNMQIGDFFVLTTSLSEANLLKRTKEVEIVSGE
ncbi:MAG: hypothetical protein J6U85_03740 [Bacteroidales bacterium]|nr:hypothetical protein [Bacteroidales bacterium]